MRNTFEGQTTPQVFMQSVAKLTSFLTILRIDFKWLIINRKYEKE